MVMLYYCNFLTNLHLKLLSIPEIGTNKLLRTQRVKQQLNENVHNVFIYRSIKRVTWVLQVDSAYYHY